MKTFLVLISVEIPYPKTFTYRIQAGQAHVALARAMKLCRKELGRKRINEWKINVTSLGSLATLTHTQHAEANA